jgi:hypothetical protein
MGRYFFKITDQESSLQPDRSYEFDSLEDAESEAKVALAEMAVDGLPGLAGGALAVEVQDAGRRPLVDETSATRFPPVSTGYSALNYGAAVLFRGWPTKVPAISSSLKPVTQGSPVAARENLGKLQMPRHVATAMMKSHEFGCA